MRFLYPVKLFIFVMFLFLVPKPLAACTIFVTPDTVSIESNAKLEDEAFVTLNVSGCDDTVNISRPGSTGGLFCEPLAGSTRAPSLKIEFFDIGCLGPGVPGRVDCSVQFPRVALECQPCSLRYRITSLSFGSLIPGGIPSPEGTCHGEFRIRDLDNVNVGSAEFTVNVTSSVAPTASHKVQVWQDPLGNTPFPIANTEFNIGIPDLSNPRDPIATSVEIQVSDDNGFINLPDDFFSPGDPFFIDGSSVSVPAVKKGHEDVDNIMYGVFVDNLIVDNDGKIIAATLAENADDTTQTFLAHTSIVFNLVVSIKWLANDTYIEGLKAAFRNASNYLYDVSNGQAFLNKVAIYDDNEKWDVADIRIYADNTQWPKANPGGVRFDHGHVHLPPKHFGTKEKNILGSFLEQPLNPDEFENFITIVHELGHYLFGFFDEYQDKDENLVFPGFLTFSNINFGFMDDPSDRNKAISSEMSAFVTQEYQSTAQFQVNDQ